MTKDKILKLLSESGGEYISGEHISRLLGITRSAVWKGINALRKEGFTVESSTNRGYRLIAKTHCLSETSVRARLTGSTIAGELHFFDSVTSTFDKLQSYRPREGLTVLAARQTNGRGRLGRGWSSESGGVYFSFMLLPPIEAESAPFITLICALAVQRALSEYADCEIKWPNDIVSEGKKLCGILTRTSLCQDEIENVLVGIGINVNNESFRPELANAVSLKLLCGKSIDENELFASVVRQIDRAYYSESRESVLSEYKKVCVNLSKEVTIHFADGRGDIRGICTDILPDGSMNVAADTGILNVKSGEVSVKGIYESERTQK